MSVVFDPLLDMQKILKDKWNTTSGGAKPTIELGQNIRYVPLQVNADYIYLISLNESDNQFGIGAQDYRRDIAFTVVVRTPTNRNRLRQLIEECRRILRNKSNWIIYDTSNAYLYRYLDLKMSKTIDNSDQTRKFWWLQFDVNTFRIENI